MEIIETTEDLAFRAKVARQRAKETQQQAADRFEKHVQTIAAAENRPEKSLNELRMQMIASYDGVLVDQVWRIRPVEAEKKSEAAQSGDQTGDDSAVSNSQP